MTLASAAVRTIWNENSRRKLRFAVRLSQPQMRDGGSRHTDHTNPAQQHGGSSCGDLTWRSLVVVLLVASLALNALVLNLNDCFTATAKESDDYSRSASSSSSSSSSPSSEQQQNWRAIARPLPANRTAMAAHARIAVLGLEATAYKHPADVARHMFNTENHKVLAQQDKVKSNRNISVCF